LASQRIAELRLIHGCAVQYDACLGRGALAEGWRAGRLPSEVPTRVFATQGIFVLAVIVALLAFVMVLSALFEELAVGARHRLGRRRVEEHVPAE
jgi:hypothetical protein